MKKLNVDLGENSYSIIINRGAIRKAADYFSCRGDKALIISDTNVAPLYASAVEDSIKSKGLQVRTLVLPAGEKTKEFNSLPLIYSQALDFSMTRGDMIITLGGGVIGDLGGFAAATYMRGIDFVQIPTSLLAQVDSSVGGKVGIDLPQGKNLVGAFHQPKAVIIDPDTLDTLTDSFFADGMGEVIKYGCIADSDLFDMLDKIGSRENFGAHAEEIIARCCDIKRRIVEEDEKENGCRKLLNFGHTYGHALEKVNDYTNYSHGQAVAIGMIYITLLSEQEGLTTLGTAKRIEKLCGRYGLPIKCNAIPEQIKAAVSADKKSRNGGVDAVFLKDIGESFVRLTPVDYFGAEVWQ